MRTENLEDIIKQLKSFSGGLHILEDEVPIEEQKEYFDYARTIRAIYDDEIAEPWIHTLFSPNSGVEQKRQALTLLAGLLDIAAFRAIETYHSAPQEDELINWSALALIESKMLISSDLSDERQVFISTGMGGHNGKLRFFLVLASHENLALTDFQQETLEREFRFQTKQYEIDLEEFEMTARYAKIVLLASLDKDLKSILKSILDECNQYGHFMRDTYILTNMRKFEDKEIEGFLDKKHTK